MRYTLFSIAIALLCSCAGGIQPTVFTAPPSYLASFPLDTMTEDQLVTQIGPPSSVYEKGGNRLLAYTMGEAAGVRTYTYKVTNDIITDVTYHDSGYYSGSSARKVQGK